MNSGSGGRAKFIWGGFLEHPQTSLGMPPAEQSSNLSGLFPQDCPGWILKSLNNFLGINSDAGSVDPASSKGASRRIVTFWANNQSHPRIIDGNPSLPVWATRPVSRNALLQIRRWDPSAAMRVSLWTIIKYRPNFISAGSGFARQTIARYYEMNRIRIDWNHCRFRGGYIKCKKPH